MEISLFRKVDVLCLSDGVPATQNTLERLHLLARLGKARCFPDKLEEVARGNLELVFC